jgi:hypothetical protein
LCCVLLTRYHSGFINKKTDMSRACSTYGGEERCVQGFSGENLREGDFLADPGFDGRII